MLPAAPPSPPAPGEPPPRRPIPSHPRPPGLRQSAPRPAPRLCRPCPLACPGGGPPTSRARSPGCI
eukprot:9855822-Alexandrium_andersonii.AAC.1